MCNKASLSVSTRVITNAMRAASRTGFNPYDSHSAQSAALQKNWKRDAGRRTNSRSEYTANMLLATQAE